MKRIIMILVVCLLCSAFSGCDNRSGSHTDSSLSVPLPEVNFNNNYWFAGDFWSTGDALFYMKDGFYNMGVYQFFNNIHTKLFEESDFAGDATIGEIFPWGNDLYFDVYSDSITTLYRYSLESEAYAAVCEFPRPYRWVIADDHLIYREHMANNEEKHSPLWAYSLEDGSGKQVCSNVEEFGIVEGKLRYITYGERYELYQYDYAEDHSAFLGAFDCKFGDAYDIFNFTPDGLVMHNWDRDFDRSLAVYSLTSDATAVYVLPREIHNLIACDEYAFAVVYDTAYGSSTSLSDAKNGIYRIRLSDGSYEILDSEADEDTEIHVTSDDTIYITQRYYGFLSRARRHVYSFDCKTMNKVKLTDD